MTESKKPKILVFDLETAPITAYTWGLFDQNIGLNQIKSDWHLLAWAAKWLGDPPSKVMYMDNRNARNAQCDEQLVRGLSNLLNEADIIVTQNGEKFDVKKLNARAIINGLPPIKPCMSTDILKESRKVFSFTSHKLEYMTEKLNKKYKKLKHSKYPGFELWKAVLSGDKKAWDEMKKYTIHDVLSTEETYNIMQGWIRIQPFSNSYDDSKVRCKCGSAKLEKRGYAWTDAGKYQIYRCQDCGKWPRAATNLLSQAKRAATLRELKGAK